MARIPYPDPNQLSSEDQKLLEELPPLNAFRMLAGAPALFQPLVRFFSAYLSDGCLEQNIREIAILRVGHLCGSDYEVIQHQRASRSFGLSEAWIKATEVGEDQSVFSDKEKAVLNYVDDVMKNVRAGQTFDALSEHMTHEEMIELTLLIGTYITWCQLFECFDVDIEDEAISPDSIDHVRDAIGALKK